MNQWVRRSEREPDKSGLYYVYVPTADENSPYFGCAWYEPQGTGNLPGWQLLPQTFCDGITHWMKPDRPESDWCGCGGQWTSPATFVHADTCARHTVYKGGDAKSWAGTAEYARERYIAAVAVLEKVQPLISDPQLLAELKAALPAPVAFAQRTSDE